MGILEECCCRTDIGDHDNTDAVYSNCFVISTTAAFILRPFNRRLLLSLPEISNMKPSNVPKTIIRRILRNLKTNVPLVGGDSSQPTRAFVVEQYRSPGSPTLQKLSETYAQLLTDLKERKRLHELDTGADLILSPRELSRRAAARAGLQLPQLDEGHPSFIEDQANRK